MNDISTGQRIICGEGIGEVLTVFEDKVVVKLANGETTTLPANQVTVNHAAPSGQTDLTQEEPEAIAQRAEHAGEILARLDHTNENQNINQQQTPMEISEKAMDVINDLIEINNDRVEGFEKAARDLEGQDTGLDTVFNKLASESREYSAQLTAIAQDSGFAPVEGTSTSGALHRAWIDIKATFTGSDITTILNECERGEDAIKAAYDSALDPENELGTALTDVLLIQQKGVIEGHDLIKSLRDEVETQDNADDQDEYEEDEDATEATELEPGFPVVGASADPAGQGFVNQPTYDGAAGEYNQQGNFEPETAEAEEAWQDQQATGNGNSKLAEFFINELQDLLWAERELADTLPDMGDAATSVELRNAFENHSVETETHIARLEQAFAILGLEPEGRKCEAMAGIIDEGDDIIDATEDGTAQRDVGLIFAGQKAEHYEIASYGGMIALAKTLGYYDIAELFVLTLDEEKTADALLTQIAETQANYAASTEPAED